MKRVKTTQGKGYVVTAVTVPCRILSNGIELARADSVGQVSFVAIAEEVDVDQDDAIITPVFKGASLGLSAKGGEFPYKYYISGDGAFRDTDIESWDVPLPALKNGRWMFGYTKMMSFSVPLPSLTEGYGMFYLSKIKSWSNPLPLLNTAEGMFFATQMTSFSVPLPSLTNGFWMFNDCRLDKPSVLTILNSLQTMTANPIMTIGSVKACQGDADIATAITATQSRGWTVQITYHV